MSARSLAAVLAFMTTGIITSTSCSVSSFPFRLAMNDNITESVVKSLPTDATVTVGTIIATAAAGAAFQGLLRKIPLNSSLTEQDEHCNNKRKIIPAIICAKCFALGLIISQMTLSSKVLGFLDVTGIKNGSWDPTLACVMGGGLIVSFLSYQWVKGFNYLKVSAVFLSLRLSSKLSLPNMVATYISDLNRTLRPLSAH